MSKIIKGKNKGFIALISIILVSAALMAAVLQNTAATASAFDEANRKEHRFLAIQSALACLDQAVLELTHDYFFSVSAASSSSGVSYQERQCSIVLVGETAGGIPGDGRDEIMVAGFSSGIIADLDVEVLLSAGKINLVSEKTFFK